MKSFYALILASVLTLMSADAFAVSTALTIATTSESGLAMTTVTADTTNGNSYDNTNGDVMLILENTHASNSETFNVAVQNASITVIGMGSVTKTNPLAVVVPALSRVIIGPLPKKAYNDASNLVQVTYTGTGTPKVLPIKGLNLQYAGG
jgi:hypothetical protein